MSHLTLIHDQSTIRDEILPGCQRFPVWWTPDSGVEHAGTVIGVRWRCPRCGIEGHGVFGHARELPLLANNALAQFINSDAAKEACVYHTTPVERYSPW
ncbi:hypothetical protein [Shimia sp.]|uniref:hypothetical protein n=1 Tax=Shimia sp. TaxID=1954381 RepID=UPI0032978C53